ncbi:MAG: hypothetical protein KBD25_05425 [Rickettsiaceae bacterium]|nr:hypothetical protein [Rickettsiaceae bacterium]
MINIDEFQYEKRVILFLDIIGWKEIIGQNNSVSDLMAEIVSAKIKGTSKLHENGTS